MSRYFVLVDNIGKFLYNEFNRHAKGHVVTGKT